MGTFSWDADAFSEVLQADLAGCLAACRTLPDLATLVARAAVAAETVCMGRACDCGAGCPHCCVLNVAVLLPEAAVIADHLRATCPATELTSLMARLAAHVSWGRWMDDEERIARQVWCPFLDAAGSCAIHPVRPLACRGVASLERERCREAFNPIISDQDRLVPADLLRRAAYDAAFASLAGVLGQQGMDDRSIELGAGVLAFLECPAHGDLLLGGGRLPGELWT